MFGKEKVMNQMKKKHNSYYKKGITQRYQREKEQHVLPHSGQLRLRTEPENLEMKEEFENEEQEEKETYDFNFETEQGIEESDNKSQEKNWRRKWT